MDMKSITNLSSQSTTNYDTDNNNNNFDTNLESIQMIQIKYLTYEELPSMEQNTKLLMLMRNISTHILEPTSTWLYTFNAITELRRVRKFYPELFEHFFNIMVNVLSEMLILSNTAISRNILKLTSEIFTYHEYNHSFSDWLQILLPKVLIKSISEIKIVQEEADQVLENLINNIFYPETIEILLENVINKNNNISNKSFDFLMKLLNNFDSFSFVHISECINWERVLYILLDLFEIKKEMFINKAYKILDYLQEIFKNFEDGYCDNFSRILSQIESLDFHAKFERFLKAKSEFYNMKDKKRERNENLHSTRHSIKSDKKSGGRKVNNFWQAGIIEENKNYREDKDNYNNSNNNHHEKFLVDSSRYFGKENFWEYNFINRSNLQN